MIDETFYKVVDKQSAEPLHCRYTVIFNVNHDIFKAHFPGNPIVPGVCSLEIVRQLVACMLEIETEARIISVKNMKFVSLMTPSVDKRFVFDIALSQKTDSQYVTKVSILDGDSVAVKASLVCEIQ